jgi:hypothetical protein
MVLSRTALMTANALASPEVVVDPTTLSPGYRCSKNCFHAWTAEFIDKPLQFNGEKAEE